MEGVTTLTLYLILFVIFMAGEDLVEQIFNRGNDLGGRPPKPWQNKSPKTRENLMSSFVKSAKMEGIEEEIRKKMKEECERVGIPIDTFDVQLTLRTPTNEVRKRKRTSSMDSLIG